MWNIRIKVSGIQNILYVKSDKCNTNIDILFVFSDCKVINLGMPPASMAGVPPVSMPGMMPMNMTGMPGNY